MTDCKLWVVVLLALLNPLLFSVFRFFLKADGVPKSDQYQNSPCDINAL